MDSTDKDFISKRNKVIRAKVIIAIIVLGLFFAGFFMVNSWLDKTFGNFGQEQTVFAAAAVSDPPQVATISFSGEVKIDCRQTLKEMIADGDYSWISPGYDDQVKLNCSDSHDIEMQLIDINPKPRFFNGQEARVAIDRLGYRPATLEELLAFGATYPKEQYKYDIVALGSTYVLESGTKYVPTLFHYSTAEDQYDIFAPDVRYLGLEYDFTFWIDSYRFAVVKK